MLKSLSRDVSRMLGKGKDQLVLKGYAWEGYRNKIREVLAASKTTINWISGMIYHRDRLREKHEARATAYHKNFLQKLKKIFRKKDERNPTLLIKDQLRQVNSLLNEQ